MKTQTPHKLIIFSFVILAINGLIGFAVYQSTQKMQHSEHWVQHTEQTIHQSEKLLSLSREIETSTHGLMNSNDSFFQASLFYSEKKIAQEAELLKQLIRDNPTQRIRVDALNDYIRKHLDFSLKLVESRSKTGWSSTVTNYPTDQGKYFSDRMRYIIYSIQQEEESLLKVRKFTNEQSMIAFNRFLIVMFIIMTGFTILLLIVFSNYLFQNKKKQEYANDLTKANKELVLQNQEKEKRAEELVTANNEMIFQNDEKAKRAAELLIANKELAFQNQEKEKRAAELIVANGELIFQNQEKEKRAAELIVANTELEFQNREKEKRAEELNIANIELNFQKEEKERRAVELIRTNMELLKIEDELKEYIKGLEEMMFMTSHQVRQPIANILGIVDLLQNSINSPNELIKIVDYIKHSAVSLDNFTKELTQVMSNLEQNDKYIKAG